MTPPVLIKTTTDKLKAMKAEYVQQLPAPLDGMWEIFTDMADQYAISSDDKIVGYCAINDNNQLLQYYTQNSKSTRQIFQKILNEMSVTGAMVSTNEPAYLSLVMDHQTSVDVNALMYRLDQSHVRQSAVFPKDCRFRLVEAGELEEAVDFAVAALGADREWLLGYYGERIKKSELFGIWQNDLLIAAGERRVSATQKPYADVGMVVAENQRGKAMATNILLQLINICEDEGLKAICSTESDNIAAQKAIERAGFVSDHRVLKASF